MLGDVMNRKNPLPPDEAQLLQPHSPRIAVEGTDHQDHSYEGARLHPSPPASTRSYSTSSEGRGETATAYVPVHSQQQEHLGVHNRSHESSTRSNNCVWRLWLWEILSIAVAAHSLAAIVITLVLRRDRPLPKLPSAITINALIAVFTAIFKACLMMSIAECIGQLKWLWYQKFRPLRHMEQWDLASRGGLPCFFSSATHKITTATIHLFE